VATNDKVKQTWSQADMAGYRTFQQALLEYGEKYFSTSQMLAMGQD
jgi:hypothetical protein